MMLTATMVCPDGSRGLWGKSNLAISCRVLYLSSDNTSLASNSNAFFVGRFIDRADPSGSNDNSVKSQDEYAARMFQMFFGGSEMYGAPTLQSGLRRGRDVHHSHRVSLEDLYCGRTSHVAVQKSVICSACLGFGGREVCWPGVLFLLEVDCILKIQLHIARGGFYSKYSACNTLQI